MSTFGIDIPEEQVHMFQGEVSKHEALDTLIHAVGKNPVITDCEAFRKAVYNREEVMSTGIGDGIAIPHVRIPEVLRATIGVGIAPHGIDFDTLDNKPVYILVLFATPEGSNKEYLGLLAHVMMALRNKDFFRRLLSCRTAAEVHAALNA